MEHTFVIALAAGLSTAAANANPSFSLSGNNAHQPAFALSPEPRGDLNGWKVDISGFQSVDAAGSPLNKQIDIPINAGFFVYAIEYDFTISTFGSSWLSDVSLSFFETDEQFIFTPGVGDDTPGTASYSSGGVLQLADFGIQPFHVDPGGTVSIEIYESFVDNPGFSDAAFRAGSRITLYAIAFPSPSSLGLLGFGAVVLGRRRR